MKYSKDGITSFDGGKYGTIGSNGIGCLTIAKNREGTTGHIPFRHNESLTVISDYAIQTSNTNVGQRPYIGYAPACSLSGISPIDGSRMGY